MAANHKVPNMKPSTVSHKLPEHPDPAKKRLVVFVHGFGSSPICWDRLLKLLREDSRITEMFDLACFGYPTAWFNARFLRRIPRLLEIARSLAAFLESPELRTYRELILVGHSQGGLVIQSYLVDKLGESRLDDLYRLREVILIATPNLGSTLLSGVRKLFGIFFANPQERTLRVFDTEITEMRGKITERIVGPGGQQAVAWPIPVRCFWGMQDGIVLEASARGPFDTDLARPLKGDHFTILQPDDRQDERYKLFAESLLEPCGHRCVYEIELYDIRIDVAPVLGSQDFEFPHGDRTIKLRTDNIAHVNRTLKFSGNNRCTDLFPMRYGTRQDGYLKADMSHPNEALPQDKQAYEDHGNTVVFDFRPIRGETYKFNVTVYKGYDQGNRNAHFHVIPPDKKIYFKKIHVELDLTAYLAAGWVISQKPSCYHFPRNQDHKEFCAQRQLNDPLTPLETKAPGLWTWELEGIREGVVDLIWDVAKAPVAPVAAVTG